jgi:hypothetical protein
MILIRRDLTAKTELPVPEHGGTRVVVEAGR